MTTRPLTESESTLFYGEASLITDRMQKLPKKQQNSQNPKYVKMHAELLQVWKKHHIIRQVNDLVVEL